MIDFCISMKTIFDSSFYYGYINEAKNKYFIVSNDGKGILKTYNNNKRLGICFNTGKEAEQFIYKTGLTNVAIMTYYIVSMPNGFILLKEDIDET